MSSNFLVNVYGTNTDVLSIINAKTVNTIEIRMQNSTNQKYNMTFNQSVAILTNDITVGINGYCLNGEQKYTFGPAQQPLFVGGGQGGNSIAFSTNGLTWNGLGSTTFTTSENTLAYNGRIWAAGGTGGNTLAYSWDGKLWTPLGKTIFSTSCNYIAWNGSLFVATGSGTNGLAYSYDGIQWTGTGTSILTTGQVVAWNGSIWVAGGNKLAYSTNGTTWTVSTSGTALFTTVYGVTWNGNTWLAGGSGTSRLAYSIDGINWTNISYSLSTSVTTPVWNGSQWTIGGIGGNTFIYTTDSTGQSGWVGAGTTVFSTQTNLIKWTGKYFIGMGQTGNTLAYSLNGINWIGLGTSIITTAGKTIEYNSLRPHSITIPRYMVIAGGQYATSSNKYSYDGINWTTANFNFGYMMCVKYNGKIWISGGSGGGSDNSALAYSYDGINWTGLGSTIFSTCYSVVWNGTIWVAVGTGSTGPYGNSIAVSYDGILWIGVYPYITGTYTNAFRDVAWNGSYFIAVNTGGNTSVDYMKYSKDGINWSPVNQNVVSTIRGICSNGIIWVAVAAAPPYISYSYDGIVWTGVPSIFTKYGWKVAWNGNMFIAVGAGTNCAAYSYDGINWTGLGSTPFSQSTGAYAIVWDGIRWQMGGNSASNAYSYDGINWTTYLTPFGSGRCFASNYNAPPNVYIQHPTVAVGTGQNTIAYSEDGITWRGLGQNIFDGEGYDVAWNGSLWVAVGLGSVNTMAISQDGLQWTGLGNYIFSTSGNGISWNGQYWIATGAGANTLAYSQNGTYWFGLGNIVFSKNGYGVAWNGTSWIAMGQGGNTIAYSPDSITWTGIGTSVFSTLGYDITTNGNTWVATGQGSNCLAYTFDITGATGWTQITGVFDTTGTVGNAYGITWNGSTWVAVGQPAGSSTTIIAYSTNGITWTGVSNSPFNIAGLGVCWNGVRFVATGYGGNAIAYSPNGINWYGGYNGYSNGSTFGNIFSTYGNCVASNPGVGAVPIQSQMILNASINGKSSLDIVTPAYYQPGYSGFSVKIEQNNLY